MFKVNNKNTRTTLLTRSRLEIERTEKQRDVEED